MVLISGGIEVPNDILFAFLSLGDETFSRRPKAEARSRTSIPGLLRGLGFAIDIFRFFYLDFGDTVTFHLFDGIAMAFVFEGFAEVRNALQSGQYESGEGFKSSIAGKEQVVLGFEVTNVHRALEHENSFVRQRRFRGCDVEFVFDVADYLLSNLFD